MEFSRKNILYLAHRIPYPPNKGDKIRSYNEVAHLAKKHNVDLICLADEPGDLKYKKNLEKICGRVAVLSLSRKRSMIAGIFGFLKGQSITEGYFYKDAFQQLVNSWMGSCHYDAVLCFSSPMAEYIFRSKEISCSTRLIMDFCDVDSDKWKQYAKDAAFPLSYLYSIENRRLLSYEKKVNRYFHQSIFVSPKERDLFMSLVPGALNCHVASNGVDTEYFSPSQKKTNDSNLMFAGAMDYHANIQGITWFCEHVFPGILDKNRNITLNIVGSNPVQEVRDLAKHPNINVTGFVKDIREYYREASVCIVPLHIARGVQNKVLEAMAMEKPIVSTPEAIQGIEASPGKHLLVASSKGDFTHTLNRLLSNPELKRSLGTQARERVLEKYAWSENMNQLSRLVQS